MSEKLGFEINLDTPYETTIENLSPALKAEGFGILTRIDVQATMKEKLGKEFKPFAILGACNPVLAHKALAHNPEIGLLLPCNITVEASSSGGSIVRIVDPVVMLHVGPLANDPILEEVSHEARSRLQRVAAALNQSGQ